MLAIISALCECVKSFRRVVGTMGSSVNALANEYLKELATVDEPVETVSVLRLTPTAPLLQMGGRQLKRRQG